MLVLHQVTVHSLQPRYLLLQVLQTHRQAIMRLTTCTILLLHIKQAVVSSTPCTRLALCKSGMMPGHCACQGARYEQIAGMSTYMDDQSVFWSHLGNGRLQAYITQPETPLQLLDATCKATGGLSKAEHGVCFTGKGRIKLRAL